VSTYVLGVRAWTPAACGLQPLLPAVLCVVGEACCNRLVTGVCTCCSLLSGAPQAGGAPAGLQSA
jgi:hypothetical protein